VARGRSSALPARRRIEVGTLLETATLTLNLYRRNHAYLPQNYLSTTGERRQSVGPFVTLCGDGVEPPLVRDALQLPVASIDEYKAGASHEVFHGLGNEHL
jgi:hypothetical protein